ncbi:hypothetical protein TAMA11512_21680 [Selenomonas sp. TAMA-11512]|uniref:hypothetical protein n=1 Tax=Selenomonas sp. TAMA-11512 TaxID=3095337 RepID=UPI00309029C9|nr:hypothetical protein TAMA11512_21680 [Selenomonas sp. TAMA-11512]
MKTKVVQQVNAFTLQGSNYNGTGDIIEVGYSELEAAPVGTVWNGFDDHNCGRDLREESAEVVYKNNHGCAVLFREWGTTDEPDPKDWESAPELVWYEF